MPNKQIDLARVSKEELLRLKICDLPLTLKENSLQGCIEELYRELESKNILFKPVCYLADEWLTPDEEPVIGIPFFLAHPALAKLEREMMHIVEGGTRAWCMKLLRHEAGHAVNYAYRLYKRTHWRKVFVPFSREYGETYRFRPYSKNFVRHLEDYYAQYHPDEDFAETFAVWLTPDSDWADRYHGWPVLRKLRYVDTLARQIAGTRPKFARGKRYWQLSSLRLTLASYYKRKKRLWAENFSDFYDSSLKRIFIEQPRSLFAYPAHEFVARHRKVLLACVCSWTGERRFTVRRILDAIGKRCQVLHLVMRYDEQETMAHLAACITTMAMNYLYTGRFGRKKQLCFTERDKEINA
ncbi:MAG: putative zinc-binding metallopeptidase [Candidatus Omnitrophica bacterium]|nr:putative zinc-binding metallopeptidase [Candidatus Omnitrophota bacterium]